jgi:hypothetical protein
MFRFVKRDVGKGHRGRDVGDCQVRTLAVAAGIRWPDAWRLLYTAQERHRTCAFNLTEFMKAEPEVWGVIRALALPAERGRPRMTPRTFAEAYPGGNWVLRLANHVAAMEDGVLYDTWDCSERCVYAAYEIDPAAYRQEVTA